MRISLLKLVGNLVREESIFFIVKKIKGIKIFSKDTNMIQNIKIHTIFFYIFQLI